VKVIAGRDIVSRGWPKTTTGRNTCWKRMFQVFQRYDAIVAYKCCKSRSGCCPYCNGYTCMLQNVYSKCFIYFSDLCCNCVLSGCCICFTEMLQEFVQNVSSISNACFKCFIWMFHMFHTYVTRFCSKYFICFTCMLQQVFFGVASVFTLQALNGTIRITRCTSIGGV
jgi:hypothetical protein